METERALFAAIRSKCMDCSGNCKKMVERCTVRDCPLYPYRKGNTANKKAEDKPLKGQMSLFCE